MVEVAVVTFVAQSGLMQQSPVAGAMSLPSVLTVFIGACCC